MGISQYFRSKEELMAQQEPDTFQADSRRYVKNDTKCPRCEDDNVNWGNLDPEGDTVFRYCDCNTCGYEWTERYILAGLDTDPQSRNVLAFEHNDIKGYVSVGEDGLILHLDSDPPHISYNIMMLVHKPTRPKY